MDQRLSGKMLNSLLLRLPVIRRTEPACKTGDRFCWCVLYYQ